MGSLIKMKLIAYKDREYKKQLSKGVYEVMLNPESIKWERSIDYDLQQPPNSSTPSQLYKATPGYGLNFDIIIDCTGVVDGERIDLDKEIKQLQKVVYDYNGDTHQPNYVRIVWGKDINFQGVLKNFDTSYTLFRPNGSALRAKVSLSFTSYLDAKKAAKIEDKKSPDMTHLVDVVEGDSLSSLSERIWNNPFHYVQVAEFNNLNKIRKITPGERLFFPPLKAAAE